MIVHTPREGWVACMMAILLGVSACTPQRTDSARAIVTTHQGLPCFSVEDRPDTRHKVLTLAYVQVVDANGHQAWDARFREGTRITPARCIAYGSRTEGMTTATPATPLAVGRRYRVVVMAPVAEMPSAPQGYTASFCMTPAGPAPLATPTSAGSCEQAAR